MIKRSIVARETRKTSKADPLLPVGRSRFDPPCFDMKTDSKKNPAAVAWKKGGKPLFSPSEIA